MIRTKKPCSECPFVKGSLQGWLGPWTAPNFIRQLMSEDGQMCHSTITEDGVITPGTQICTGGLICANKSAKSYRNPDLRKLQEEVGKDDNVMTAFEFKQYHKRDDD